MNRPHSVPSLTEMIFATADTHGPQSPVPEDGFVHRFSVRNMPQQKEMTKNDFVILCGDFGGVWDIDPDGTKEENWALDWLDRKPFTALIVPGNHENYDRLTGIHDPKLLSSWLFDAFPNEKKQELITGLPRTQWHGGYVRTIRPSVLMLEPGLFEIQGKRCLVFGGAKSLDAGPAVLNPLEFETRKAFREYEKRTRLQTGRCERVRGVSWWPQEEYPETTQNTILTALRGCESTVNFIFTHSGAIDHEKALFGTQSNSKTAAFLQCIKENVRYEQWYFGHYHINKTLPGGKDHALYDQILRIL